MDFNIYPHDSKGCYHLPMDEEWEQAVGNAMMITSSFDKFDGLGIIQARKLILWP